MRRTFKSGITVLLATVSFATANAQKGDQMELKQEASKKKWYESFSIRGYVQARYNRILETNDKLSC